jgi:hypothetical protein
MRRRASHPAPHRSWISQSPAFPPLGRRETTVLVRQRSQKGTSATFTSTGRRAREYDSQNRFSQPLRWPAAQPAQRAGSGGGRNARATGSRSRAFPISPGNSPSRIASCHRRHRNHRSASFEVSNVFAEPTLIHNVATRNTKNISSLVQKLWTIETSLWKAEEKTPKPRLSNRTTESPTKPSTGAVIFDPGVPPAP